MSLDHSTGRCLRKLLAVAAITAAATQPASAGGQTHRIEMKDVAFMPTQVTVRAGDTLEWDNADIVAHTATSKDAGFDVPVLPGRKSSTVVTRPGTFRYICRYHPTMTGQVVVVP